MKRLIPVLAAVAILAFSIHCHATDLAYDGFNYTPVGSVITGQSGGGSFGWSDAWSGVTSGPFTIGAGSLSAPDDPTPSSGNMLTTGISGSNKDTHRDLATPLGTPGTTDYFSFLLQPNGTVGQGFDDGHFGLELSGTLNTVFVGKPGAAAPNPNLYVIETLGGSGQVPTSVVPVSGQTEFMVVKAEWGTTTDKFSLYINPTVPGGGTPLAVKDDISIGTLTSLYVGGPGAFSFDELRVSTTFPSVIAPTPEPSSFLLCGLGALGLLLAARRRRKA